MDPIEEVIPTSFLPSLFGRVQPLPEELKELVNLSPAQGGIGIPDLKHESLEQFNASLDITAPHFNSTVTPFAFATTFLCLISLVTVLVERCLLSTMRCHARREVL